jgi:hypothetical protein
MKVQKIKNELANDSGQFVFIYRELTLRLTPSGYDKKPPACYPISRHSLISSQTIRRMKMTDISSTQSSVMQLAQLDRTQSWRLGMNELIGNAGIT